jgi:hypothetical protein
MEPDGSSFTNCVVGTGSSLERDPEDAAAIDAADDGVLTFPPTAAPKASAAEGDDDKEEVPHACDNNDCDSATTECLEDPESMPAYVCSCLDGMVPDGESFTNCVKSSSACSGANDCDLTSTTCKNTPEGSEHPFECACLEGMDKLSETQCAAQGLELTFAPTLAPDGGYLFGGPAGDGDGNDGGSSCDSNDCDTRTAECFEDDGSDPPYVCMCLDGFVPDTSTACKESTGDDDYASGGGDADTSAAVDPYADASSKPVDGGVMSFAPTMIPYDDDLADDDAAEAELLAKQKAEFDAQDAAAAEESSAPQGEIVLTPEALSAFYEVHAPDRVANVPEIIEQSKGSVQELVDGLLEKYGEAPETSVVPGDDDAAFFEEFAGDASDNELPIAEAVATSESAAASEAAATSCGVSDDCDSVSTDCMEDSGSEPPYVCMCKEGMVPDGDSFTGCILGDDDAPPVADYDTVVGTTSTIDATNAAVDPYADVAAETVDGGPMTFAPTMIPYDDDDAAEAAFGTADGADAAAGAAGGDLVMTAEALSAFYEQYAPDRVANVPEVIEQSKGSVQDLVDGLLEKYGEAPETSVVPGPDTAEDVEMVTGDLCQNNDCDPTTTECVEDPVSEPPYVCTCLDNTFVPDGPAACKLGEQGAEGDGDDLNFDSEGGASGSEGGELNFDTNVAGVCDTDHGCDPESTRCVASMDGNPDLAPWTCVCLEGYIQVAGSDTTCGYVGGETTSEVDPGDDEGAFAKGAAEDAFSEETEAEDTFSEETVGDPGTIPEGAVTITEQALTDFYLQYSPDRVDNVANVIQESKGNEHDLLDGLMEKYGAIPAVEGGVYTSADESTDASTDGSADGASAEVDGDGATEELDSSEDSSEDSSSGCDNDDCDAATTDCQEDLAQEPPFICACKAEFPVQDGPTTCKAATDDQDGIVFDEGEGSSDEGAAMPPAGVNVELTEEALSAFYEQYSPDRVKNVPNVIEESKGHVQDLLDALQDKYGDVPEYLEVGSDDDEWKFDEFAGEVDTDGDGIVFDDENDEDGGDGDSGDEFPVPDEFAEEDGVDGDNGDNGDNGDAGDAGDSDEAGPGCDNNDCDAATTECQEDPGSEPPFICACKAEFPVPDGPQQCKLDDGSEGDSEGAGDGGEKEGVEFDTGIAGDCDDNHDCDTESTRCIASMDGNPDLAPWTCECLEGYIQVAGSDTACGSLTPDSTDDGDGAPIEDTSEATSDDPSADVAEYSEEEPPTDAGAASDAGDGITADALTEFYERYAPDRVANVPEIIEESEGREQDLLDALQSKYGDVPSSGSAEEGVPDDAYEKEYEDETGAAADDDEGAYYTFSPTPAPELLAVDGELIAADQVVVEAGRRWLLRGAGRKQR